MGAKIDSKPEVTTPTGNEKIPLSPDGFIKISNLPAGAGGGEGVFTFDQDVAAATWSINHALGYFPNVTIVDTLDRVFEGDVTYVDDNNVTVSFAVAVTGKAFLS